MDTKTIIGSESRLDGEEILIQNESGDYAPLPQKDYLLGDWHDGMRAFCLKCGDSRKWGYFIENSDDIIPPMYKEARSFQDELAPVCVEEIGLWGFIDKNNNMVIKPKYENAFPITEGLACVLFNGKWGYVNKNGKNVIKPMFDQARPFSYGFAAVKQGELWGYINKKGNWVKTPQYIEATSFESHPVLDDTFPEIVLEENIWAKVSYEENIVESHYLTILFDPRGNKNLIVDMGKPDGR